MILIGFNIRTDRKSVTQELLLIIYFEKEQQI